MLAELIEKEVRKRSNDQLPEILFRVWSERERRKGVCGKHESELACYINAALHRHRRMKAWRDHSGSYSEYSRADYKYLQAQAVYRNSVYLCGCCDKYDLPSKRKIKIANNEVIARQPAFPRIPGAPTGGWSENS